MLLEPEAKVKIRSARLLIFDDGVTDADLSRIRKYYINGVESRGEEPRCARPGGERRSESVPVLEGFTRMGEAALALT